ncbi:putative damage-inducible protein DinB [Paenibacillus phyllosphaerae]|uniref:Putative damage-inducible protein DinB n=1 Tax=Paenibacillus phyllosphaerae TaxID=274593 RepID=A0A7W5B3G8_9BACL|nr:DinB family protein [Paenibacillus phyllosphaerae]MBB3113719.1 putative damage-inducible protein DinB [Paenibacillus phyllosphaerae]
MNNFLFGQLKFVRDNTIKQVKGISEEEARTVPRGFNNNMLWNLGHILLVHEKFSFALTNEKMELPKHFAELFASGTKPEQWGTQVPGLDEMLLLLAKQIERIEQTLRHRLEEELEQPFVTSAGLELLAVKECLSFCLYHEGMHVATIKAIKQQLAQR